MPNHFEIGRVIAVDTAQVTIELNKDLKALTRTTYEGAIEVGRINSYVILPVGARRLVAMVTRVVLAEEAEIRADRTMVALPAARRVMKATLIGTLDGRAFTQGVSLSSIVLTGHSRPRETRNVRDSVSPLASRQSSPAIQSRSIQTPFSESTQLSWAAPGRGSPVLSPV